MYRRDYIWSKWKYRKAVVIFITCFVLRFNRFLIDRSVTAAAAVLPNWPKRSGSSRWPSMDKNKLKSVHIAMRFSVARCINNISTIENVHLWCKNPSQLNLEKVNGKHFPSRADNIDAELILLFSMLPFC